MNPLTLQRLRRFRSLKRAYVSFWILVGLYALSLGAELICNGNPLWIRCNGKSYFPVVRFYPDDVFTASGKFTRPDYRQLARSDPFRQNPANRMLLAPIPYGPLESVPFESIELPDQVNIILAPEPMIGTLALRPDFTIAQASACGGFFSAEDAQLANRNLAEFLALPESFRKAVAERFSNRETPSLSMVGVLKNGEQIRFSVATYTPRRAAPETVRMTFRERDDSNLRRETVRINRSQGVDSRSTFWQTLSPADRQTLADMAQRRFEEPVPDTIVMAAGRSVTVRFSKEEVRYPMRPVRGHPLGIDSAGRDVLARILYGLRISLSFGFLLVVVTMGVGILVGAFQGYYGGAVDIVGQRLIEIWDALPFLYILILMGSVFGSSFGLLLVCYGLFNWVGISYYQRAEFLRLRRMAFVEAARCMGISPLKIMFQHILPNALVPVITFFPFSLVGAIGLLAALDYLGFGLPPPTPSWGELLTQAQEYSWAWWLALYPSLALFLVMLLGVFVGEGVRAAFDPRPVSRME
ncbi:MAG: ABC transporter permease subunit [Kiritimatiellae bacterium]|nr:ABC transporter permease subunit [Kiritimatiellia bacterium]